MKVERIESLEWEEFYEMIDQDINATTNRKTDLYPDQAVVVWEMGLAAWQALQESGYQE